MDPNLRSVFLTAKTTAMIMWLFIGSWTFASVFSYLGGHEVFEHFFKSMDIQGNKPKEKSAEQNQRRNSMHLKIDRCKSQ